MTEAEARAFFDGIQHDELTQLRTAIPTKRTSELIMLLTQPNALGDLMFPSADSITEYGAQAVVAAAVLALSDEIDRRFPVRP